MEESKKFNCEICGKKIQLKLTEVYGGDDGPITCSKKCYQKAYDIYN